MPLYEYACANCGHRFEILQRIGEGHEGLTCPNCDAPEVEKQYSTFASTSDGSSNSLSPLSGSCGTSGFT